MDERLSKTAAIANVANYDVETTRDYIDQSPHIKHLSVSKLYGRLLTEVYEYAAKYSVTPQVLDLGAGEGSVTLLLLEFGAKVTAVDISSSQLEALQRKCERFGDRLELRCEDVGETLRTRNQHYDIIVVNSFLHHVPDYLGMIRDAIDLLTSHGQFFSFQDPLRYDTLGRFTRGFSDFAYFFWRVFKGDVWGGIARRMRRKRGIYLADSVHDNTEYHVTRNGVDQNAIENLFREADFQSSIVRYFSTQSRFFQPIGTAIGLKNTFAVIARKAEREKEAE